MGENSSRESVQYLPFLIRFSLTHCFHIELSVGQDLNLTQALLKRWHFVSNFTPVILFHSWTTVCVHLYALEQKESLVEDKE